MLTHNLNDAGNTKRRAASCASLIIPMFLIAANAAPSNVQSAPDDKSTKLPAFEVVSIRGHKPGYWPTFERKTFTHDGFIWINALTQAMIVYAYDLRDPKLGPNLIPDAPKWIKSDWYDIRAKMSESDIDKLSKGPPEQQTSYQRELVQSLLADRFQLRAHLVTRDAPAYELILAKNGPRNMKNAPPEEEVGVNWIDSGHGQYHGVDLSALVMLLKMLEDCPVLDKTGLTGKYDFELQWSRDPASMGPPGTTSVPSEPTEDSSRPSIFKALEEQLGLKLVPIKAPLKSIVIDHIEKPSAI